MAAMVTDSPCQKFTLTISKSCLIYNKWLKSYVPNLTTKFLAFEEKYHQLEKKSYLRVPINAMIALPSITPAYQEERNIDHKIHTASFILRANICVRGTGQVREQASRRIS